MKEHQKMAEELDCLLRITRAKRTPTLRLVFGRALHGAFTTLVQNFSSFSTVGLGWIAGKETVVADVFGNASVFFESLSQTISAPAVVNQPELFAMIEAKKQLQFVRVAIDTPSPLRKVDILKALQRIDLTSSQTQQFMLTLFEQYSENPEHAVWVSLSQDCQLQLEHGALWKHLTVDEVRRLLLSVAKAKPGLLVSSEMARTHSLLSHRLAADVVDEIVETAIRNGGMGFDMLLK